VVSGKPDPEKAMIALDGSEGSMRAVDYLCSLANGFDREVILFHAMRRIGFPSLSAEKGDAYTAVEDLVWGDAKKLIEPVMEDAKQRLVKAGLDAKKISKKVVTGVASRAKSLVDEAKKANCGTVLVGRKGVSQIEEFNIGRVGNKVIYQAEDMAVWVVG
jgi:nucleotide-binding universal stress UspA family protein